MSMKILSRKDAKEIEAMIEDVYGAKEALRDFTVLVTGKREKIWITHRDVFSIDIDKLRINSIGLYFGRIDLRKLKMSVEACSIVGPKATKNIIELKEEQLWDFLRGFDVELRDTEEVNNEYRLVKYGKEWLGIAKVDNGVLKNALPKSRKIISLTKQ